MSKVVHLSEVAHRRAKDFCVVRNLKMSEWVATLIEAATASGQEPGAREGARPRRPNVPPAIPAPAGEPGAAARTAPAPAAVAGQALVPKKKLAASSAPAPASNAASITSDEAMPIYAAPPFWAR